MSQGLSEVGERQDMGKMHAKIHEDRRLPDRIISTKILPLLLEVDMYFTWEVNGDIVE